MSKERQATSTLNNIDEVKESIKLILEICIAVISVAIVVTAVMCIMIRFINADTIIITKFEQTDANAHFDIADDIRENDPYDIQLLENDVIEDCGRLSSITVKSLDGKGNTISETANCIIANTDAINCNPGLYKITYHTDKSDDMNGYLYVKEGKGL